MRLGMVRVAIERHIEWDHPDTPNRNPILGTGLIDNSPAGTFDTEDSPFAG